ncbi:MAG: lipid-A-disaccharide synthase [Chitinophagales bacterium]
MKYYLIAGEASGDLHGSNLMRAIRAEDPAAEFRFWGGDKMQAVAQTEPVKHIRHLAFMGFWEVLSHLREITSNISFCKKDMAAWQPDVVILIDYPGFNFRLLPFLQQQKMRVFYYIAPQVWAWKEGRIEKLKKYVDRLFVIFPFEKKYFEDRGLPVDFVGHPLLDALPDIATFQQTTSKQIALVPGSRKKVVQYLLPEYLKIVDAFPEYEFVVTGTSLLGEAFYRKLMGSARAKLVIDGTYHVLQQSTAALVTSGTATLETALLGVPEVICYKGNPVSVWLARRLVKKISFIGMVNLIAGRKVVAELIQEELNAYNLITELRAILEKGRREKVLADYEEVRRLLGSAGASARAAKLMVGYLKNEPKS